MRYLILIAIYLIVGFLTVYPYSRAYYKIYTDQSMEFRPWFRAMWSPGTTFLYTIFWPGFLAYATYQYMKLRFQ